MSDITLQAIDVSVLPVEEGAEAATLAVLTAIGTPFAGPDGQPIMLPHDVYRVHIGKTALVELATAMTDAAEKLTEPKRPSGLVVPGSPKDADQVAAALRKFGG